MNTRRPRRRRRGRAPLYLLGGAVALALLVAHPLLVLFAGVLAAAIWRAEHGQRRRPPIRPAAPPRPAPRPATARPGDARARRNGWAPPAASRLVAVGMSPECAGEACVLCPGAGCACPCGHDSRVIAAMNAARADAAAVPF